MRRLGRSTVFRDVMCLALPCLALRVLMLVELGFEKELWLAA